MHPSRLKDALGQLAPFARSASFRKRMRVRGSGAVGVVAQRSPAASEQQLRADAERRLEERLREARARGSRIHLRVFPDYSAFPVWDIEGGCSADVLGLSTELASALTDWNRQWDDHHSSDPDAHTQQEFDEWAPLWIEQGRELSRRLAEELGPDFEVEYKY